MKAFTLSAWDQALLFLIVTAIVFYAVIQKPVSSNDGHPYDADSYHTMAVQVAAGEPIAELRPFGYRIALPYLVGKLAGGLSTEAISNGFRIINLLFGFLTLGLLYLFLRDYLRYRGTVLLLLLLYVLNPIAVFRFVHYIPAYTDPPALFFVLLFLVLNNRIRELTWQRSLLLSVLAVIACSFREIALSGILVMVFSQSFRLTGSAPFLHLVSARNLALSMPALIAGVLTLAVIHGTVDGRGSYDYIEQFTGVVMLLVDEPGIYVLAWLVAFGAMPLVILLGMNRAIRLCLQQRQELLVFLIGSVLLSLLAGFHTDRIVFWSYPVILLLFGLFLENHAILRRGSMLRWALLIPLAGVQLLAYRAWLPIPDDPQLSLAAPGEADTVLFAPYGDAVLGQTFASTMTEASRSDLLIQFALFALYLTVLFGLERVFRKPYNNKAVSS